MKKHMAIYGSTQIPRGYCNECKQYALIIDNQFQCCDRLINVELDRLPKRMIEAEMRKRRPSRKAVIEMLYKQDNKCIYCFHTFGIMYIHPKTGKVKKLVVCYDHFVPFAYSQNNNDYNFLCACSLCNGIKGDKIFNTLEEAREYVKRRRTKKGYTEEMYIL